MASDRVVRILRLIALTLVQWLAVVVGGLQGRAIVILEDNENLVSAALPDGVLHGGDIVAAGAVQITAAGIAGFAALAAALTILFRPQKPVHGAIIGVLAFSIIFLLGGNLASTIVATTHEATITAAPSISPTVIAALIAATGRSLRYIKTAQVLGYVIVGWIMWLFLVLATMMEASARQKWLQSGSVHPAAPAPATETSPSPQMTDVSHDEKASEERV